MTKRILQLLLALLAFVAVLPDVAADPAPRQSSAAIESAVKEYLRRETRGLPGKVSFRIGEIDSRLNLPACPWLQTFAAPGARAWGSTVVGVRCPGDNPWTIYVPVTVQVAGEFVVASRALSPGQVLTAQDLAVQGGDMAQLPAGAVLDPTTAVGKTIQVGIAAGLPLRHDMLRSLPVVQQGQAVRVVARGRGFQVSSEGQALTNAQEGHVVQVRIQSGQVVSGIARRGPLVEVGSGS